MSVFTEEELDQLFITEQPEHWTTMGSVPEFKSDAIQQSEVEDGLTWGDHGRTFMMGGASVAEGAGYIAKKLGFEDSGQFIQDLGSRAVEFWAEGLSDHAKQEMAKQFIQRNEIGEYELGDASWDTVKLSIGQSALGTMAGMGVGGAFTKGLTLVPKLPKVAAGMLGYGAGEALVASGSSGANVEKQVQGMTHEQLMEHPEYQAAFAELGDEQAAKDLIVDAASEDAAALTALSTFFLSAPFGGLMGKVFSGAPLATTRARSIASGAAGEAGQEFLQSGAEALSQNYALREHADPNQDMMHDVLNNAVGGAAAGGILGGAFGTVSPLEKVAAKQKDAEDQGGDALDQAVAGAEGLQDAVQTIKPTLKERAAGQVAVQQYAEQRSWQRKIDELANNPLMPGQSQPNFEYDARSLQDIMNDVKSAPEFIQRQAARMQEELDRETLAKNTVDYEPVQVEQNSDLSLLPKEQEGIPYTGGQLGDKTNQLAANVEKEIASNAKQERVAVLPENLQDERLTKPAYRESLETFAKSEATKGVNPRGPIDTKTDDLLTAIVKNGGINRVELEQDGFDIEDMRQHKVGILPVFREKGKSVDDMAEALVQDGYIKERNVDELKEKIRSALSGQKIMSESAALDQMLNETAEEYYQGNDTVALRDGSFDESPQVVRQAINKALSGQKLGERESRIVTSALDMVQGGRSEKIPQALDQRQAASNRRQARQAISKAIIEDNKRTNAFMGEQAEVPVPDFQEIDNAEFDESLNLAEDERVIIEALLDADSAGIPASVTNELAMRHDDDAALASAIYSLIRKQATNGQQQGNTNEQVAEDTQAETAGSSNEGSGETVGETESGNAESNETQVGGSGQGRVEWKAKQQPPGRMPGNINTEYSLPKQEEKTESKEDATVTDYGTKESDQPKEESAEAEPAPNEDRSDPESDQVTPKSDQVDDNLVTNSDQATPESDQVIDDYGEKISGAKKDLVRSLTKKYTEDDIASMPLSKIWPKKELEEIEDKQIAAFATAARAEIPAKPRKAYKLSRWVDQVNSMREFAGLLASGDISFEALLAKMPSQLEGFKNKVLVMLEVDRKQWGRIGHVREYPDAYKTRDGEKIPTPQVWVKIDGRNEYFDGKSLNDVMSKVKEKLEGGDAKDKRIQFEIRGRNGSYYINKKGDKEYRKLKEFSDPKEARAYLSENYEEVVSAWESVKERDNVKKTDVRGQKNRPRTGADHRQGKDVTVEQFSDTFGFRGIQFGNWVKQGRNSKERQGLLNHAYDAFMDLASILDLPVKALSLNGQLGMSFGARGNGGFAAAHYEPGQVVINLTKTQGAGTLAHEWFHALDNYFTSFRENAGSGRHDNFITHKPEQLYVHKDNKRSKPITKAELERHRKLSDGHEYYKEESWHKDPSHPKGVRPEVEFKFARLVDALNDSPMRKRAMNIDKGKKDGYWSRTLEMAARSFENYIITKMKDEGYHNDFLANVQPAPEFGRNPDRYPYLLDNEIAPIAEAFDELFSTIETRETESGTALYSLKEKPKHLLSGNGGDVVSRAEAESVIDRVTEKWGSGQDNVELVDEFSELPDPIKKHARIFGVDTVTMKGVYYENNGKIYLVRENLTDALDVERTIFHEGYGHFGLRQLMGDDLHRELRRLFIAIGGQRGFNTLAKKHGMNVRAYEDMFTKMERMSGEKMPNEKIHLMMDELLAHIAENNKPGIKRAFKEFIGKLRDWLRRHGFLKMSNMSESELVYLLAEARKAVHGKDTAYYDSDRYEVLFSMSEKEFDVYLEALWRQIGDKEDAYRYPAPESSSLKDIFAEMDPSYEVNSVVPNAHDKNTHEVDKKWEIISPDGKKAHLLERGNELWIDVSLLKSGQSQGSMVYAAAMGYAYNNGKQFIGDPNGLSNSGMMRRTEMMLSSALKYESTDHLQPHIRQEMPDEGLEEWVKPLDWVEGDYSHNLRELLAVSYSNVKRYFPEIENVIYNFSSGKFELKDPNTTTDYKSRRLAGTLNRGGGIDSRSAGRGSSKSKSLDVGGSVFGSSSLKRAAITNTILSQTSRSGRGLVLSEASEHLSTGQADNLSGILYSISSPQTDEKLEKFGLGPKKKTKLSEFISGQIARENEDSFWSLFKHRAYEGMFNGLIGIKRAEDQAGVTDVKQSGYVGARMATGIADVMHGILHYGAPKWKDGALQYKEGTQGLLDILGKAGADLHDFLAWVGAHRAEELMAQGREQNLTQEDIDDLKARAEGKEELFRDIHREYKKLNDAMLDMAEEAGLINPESRQGWQSDWYIPFYRNMEDEAGDLTLLAPRTKRGLSHQTAGIKQLKGGAIATNDLLENILANWMKLADASMKNSALVKTVDNLSGTDYIEEFDGESEVDYVGKKSDKNVIRIQREGRSEYYKVHDPALLRAVTHLSSTGHHDPVSKAGRYMKRLLTTGVTASPDFILRNFIRDAAHAWAINPDGFKFATDSLKGFKDALREDPAYRELMFAGASFQGGYVHGTDPEATAQIIRRALEKKGLSPQAIHAYEKSLLDTPMKGYDALKRGWQKYREFGDKIENANRLATYKAARANGKELLQAAFESKDLMDYSLRGNFQLMQYMIDLVPFMNARLQGMSKLARAAKENPKRVLIEAGFKLALFSFALAMLNDDDERYQELPDWDKDANWHFWLGDEHFRIPKPFEIGIVFGTIPERLYHTMAGNQESEKLLWSISHNLWETMAINPTPQFAMPMIESVANRKFFFDAPIEGMSDQGKLPEARYDERTSMTMRIVGDWIGMSPKKLQHLWNGYFGTMGMYALGAADAVSNWATDRPDRPAKGIEDLPVMKVFYRGDKAAKSTQYTTDVYDYWSEVEEIYRTIRAFRKEGKVEEANELQAENRNKLKYRRALGKARKQLGDIRDKMNRISRNRLMDADRKKERMDDLIAQRNAISKRFAELAEDAF